MITEDEIDTYCNQYVYPDAPVMPATRLNLTRALNRAERECARVEEVKQNMPRVLTTSLTDMDDPLRSITVIRHPRYAVRNREAPKRSTLFSRLWSMLR